jgi:hypothetical protein
MSLEKQIADDRRNIRKEALLRHVLHLVRETVQLRGVTPETNTDDVVVEMTDASARVLAPLVEAIDILEEIIWASDGCQGHKNCAHSMEPWQRARAFLKGKWDAYEQRTEWPAVDQPRPAHEHD